MIVALIVCRGSVFDVVLSALYSAKIILIGKIELVASL